MAAPPTSTDPDALARALGTELGGTVLHLHRLSGGASRVTSSFDLQSAYGTRRPLILQQDRGGGIAPPDRARVEAALLRAALEAGVPVPEVVAVGVGGEGALGPGWLVVERVEGETIPRKVQRDPEWEGARGALTEQCGSALARIHAIDPTAIDGLSPVDPFADPLPFLDALGATRPALELGARWLAVNHPGDALLEAPRVTVHGDFRLGNLLVGPEGLRAVLDWELAHVGDPAEDIGWLCAPAWRFGGPGEVGGFGSVPELLEAYATAGGDVIDPERVHWWQVYATVKWAVICALQASAHLSGATRSVELAAIGRRVCESEWDLFALLGVEPVPGPVIDSPRPGAPAPFGRPTAAELVQAVREYVERSVMERSAGAERFEARVARNVLATVERELELGPALAAAHAERVRALGFDDDVALAAAIRTGALDGRWPEVGAALAASARDQLLVANPSYLDATTS